MLQARSADRRLIVGLAERRWRSLQGAEGSRQRSAWANLAKMVPRLIAVVAPLVCNVGCNSLYLHNDGDQKAMEIAAAGVASAKETQLQALKQHDESLQQLIQQERKAVTREQIALRDSILIAAIDENLKDVVDIATNEASDALLGPEIERSNARHYLAGFLSSDSIEGKPIKRNGQDQKFSEFINVLQTTERQLVAPRRNVRSAEAVFSQQGGNVEKPCGSRGEAPQLSIIAAIEDTSAAQVEILCSLLAQQRAAFFDSYKPIFEQPSIVGCMLGEAGICQKYQTDGLVFAAFGRLEEPA